MKNLYLKTLNSKFLHLIVIITVLVGNLFSANAQVRIPFTQRASTTAPFTKNYKVKGDFTLMGNTNLTLQNYTENGNNSAPMVYVDVDTDVNTLNSSSATLVLPTDDGKASDCSNIVFAGLYWTGRSSNSNTSSKTFSVTKGNVTKAFDQSKIYLKGPNDGSYTTISANKNGSNDEIYYPTTADGLMYSAYADVTNFVKNRGIGQYTAADIALVEGNGGSTGYYGGWSMIVIYENSAMKNRDITVFDGHAYVQQGVDSYNIPVSGFNAVQTGDVGIKVGVIAGEGDRSIVGDYFKIQQKNTTTFIDLNHTGNTVNNFFNSSIQTGGNVRNPNLINNTGLDISMFKIPNTDNSIIGNNQTSTNFKYGSAQDTYVIFALAMAVDAYVPEMEGVLSTTTINGVPAVGAGPFTAQPGQELGYKVQFKNKGTEIIKNSKIVIPVPYNATYVANSATKTVNFIPLPTPNSLTFDPTLGANGSIVWDIGTLPLPTNPNTVLAELTFKFKITENCALLKNTSCDNNILVTGLMSGTGNNSLVNIADKALIQGYTTSGNCEGTAIPTPLSIAIDADAYIVANCQATPTVTAFTFCKEGNTIPITDIAGAFPAGSAFYDSLEKTNQYTSTNPFPATVGTKTYYAIPAGASNTCYFQFTITVTSITSTPTITDVQYCVGDTAIALTAVPTNPAFSLYYYTSLTSSAQSSIIPLTDTVGEVTYYVAEGQTNSCIGPKKAFKVIINGKPSLSLTSKTEIKCFGTATGSININTTGGTAPYKYTWTKDGNPFSATTEDINNLSAGVYVVTVSDKNNCSSAQLSVTINAAPAQLVLTATATPISCFGGTTAVTLNTTGGTGTYTYDAANPAITALTAGTYNYKVKDANGCEATASVTISAAPTQVVLTATAAPILCFGGTTSVILNTTGGTGAYTYDAANPAITALTAGTYTYKVKDANGCEATASVTISAAPAQVVLTATATPILCFGGTTSVILNTTGGTGTYTYDAANPAITALTAGTYTYKVKDANGCEATASVTISAAPTQVVLTATAAPILCFGGTTSVILNTTGGTGTYTYDAANPAITALTAGTYTYKVKDANGCEATASVTISAAPTQVVLTATATPILCFGGTTSVILNTTGGTGTYTYDAANPAITALTAGTYTYKVKDANGCEATASVTISAAPTQVVLTATATPILCFGGTTSVILNTTGGTGTYTYDDANPAITALTAGTYTYKVKDANGCEATASVTISAAPTQVVLTATATPILCFGGTTSVILNTTGGTGTYTYDAANPAITALTAGTYTYKVKDANGCEATASVTISAAPTQVVLTATAAPILCFGGTTTVTLNTTGGTGAYTYDAANPAITALTAGTYTYKVKDANGCEATASVTISAAPTQVVLTATATPILCFGGTTSVILNTTGGTGTYTYDAANPAITALTAGTYTYKVKDANGCEATASVTISAAPTQVVLTATATPISCFGGTTAVTLNTTGGTGTYTYDAANPAITALTAGTYTYKVKDANGCEATASVTISAAPAQVVLTATAAPILCFGGTTSVILNTTGGTGTYTYDAANPAITALTAGTYNYKVKDANGCEATASVTISAAPTQVVLTATAAPILCFGGTTAVTLNTTGGTGTYTYDAANPAISALTAGTYNYKVKDANGCEATASVTISAAPTQVVLTATATPILCFGGTTSVILNTTGGTGTYTYDAANPAITALTAGTYTYKVKDANGCEATASVTISAAPTQVVLTATATPILCFGGTTSVILNTTGGTGTYTYDAANPAITALTAGTYNYKVKDANGCEATASVTISAAPTQVVLTATAAPILCFGGTTSVILNTTGGTGTYTYDAANPAITALTAGTYTYKVKDANGCEATASVTISAAPTQVVLTATATPILCFGGTTSVILNTTGGTGTYTYDAANPAITALTAGTYNYKVKDANGCEATASVTISAAPTQVVLTATAAPILCFGGTTAVTLNTTGGTGTYTYDAANPAITALTAGTYTYKVKDANGCEATASVTITQPAAAITSVAIVTNNSNCVGCSNGTITQTVSGGTSPYTYLWSNGATTKDLTNLAKGTYSVEIKDQNGCTTNYTYAVTESGIALVKTATVSGTGKVGDVITYTFAVTNTGNTSLTNVVVTDPMVGLTITGNPIATLAVGASNATIKGTYTITQADIDAGKVVNTALATAQDPKENDVTDISGTSVDNNTPTDTPLTQNPSIALVKTATVSGTGKVGDVITYIFAVTNTGNTSLTNVVVTDPMVGLTITGNPIATLAVGASNATIKGTYTITQADIDVGKVVNTALATAQDPKENDVTDISGTSVDNNTSTDTPLTQNPSIALVKTATVSGTGKVGDVITYTFAVTNTGNTSLTNVVVTDPMVGLTITGNPIATLAVGASNATIKGTYTITQADIDAGKVVNTALATAQDPKENDVTDISGTSVDNNTSTDTPLTQNPSIALVKTATVSGTGKVGDVITYTFAVTNTGNTSLTNVVVTDPMVGLTITGNPIATLAVGASNATIKGTYTITQADIDAGKVVNTALATAQDPKENDVTDISGTSVDNNTPTDTPLTQNPSIALVKTATVSGTGKVGDVITYTFAVTNTGNTSLTNVVVTDPMVGLTITGNPIATLAVGASNATIKGTYTITQADIDAGKVVNTALATAQDPKGNDVTDISGTSVDNNTPTDTPLTQNPSIALVKTATVSGTGKVGDVITYTFAVTNTGNTSLTNVVVTDPMVGLTITGNPIATLAVGASNATIKGTYTITQADIDAGKVVNTALATAQDPKENDVTDISGTSVDNNTPTDTPLTQNPSIALVKTATVSGTGKVGDVITYTFAVTNTGNTSLTNVVVTDPMVGLTITGNPIATLAVGASNATIKGTYTITQADIDAGKVVNTALATAQDPKENDVTDISGTSVDNNTPTDTPLTQNPSIALVKTATVSGTGKVGDVITYTFAVTNTGNTSLTNVVVTDPMVGLTITGNPIATLAVGASNATIKGTYTITQADIDAGKVVNTALATAQDPKENDVTDISGTSVDNNTPTDTPLTQNPSIALVKTATVSGTGKVGDVITYTFAVTNTGNTSLTNVVVTDPMVGLTITGNPIATLAVGASNATIKGTYTITQADIDAGKVVNTALATAQDPKENDVTDISGTSVDNNTSTDTPLTQNPSIALVKTATVSGTGKVGDVITYTFAVTNTGNTSLTNVVVTDPMVGLTITGNPIATLAVGASNATIKGTYTITQADIDAGKVVNTALATAQDPKENDVTDISGTSVDNNTPTDTPLTQNPSIALVKTATVSGTGKVGDVITYTFAVTNTGNTSLTNVVVTDPMVGLTITGNPIATLAVGASNATIKGTYTITQADIDAGKVVNTALATAQDPKENDVTDISGTSVDNNTSTDTPLTQNPSIALVKTATVSGTGKVGDVITYTFAVTNTGNTSLTNVVVTDPMVGLTITGNPIATLAVGASNATIKGTYTITQADIDAGKVVNTALATAQDPKGNDVTDISGTSVDNNTPTDTPLTQNPSIALVKTATVSGTGKVGDVITYTFAVTNTGNTSLTNVVVTDPMVGLTITGNPIATLAVGASNATIKGTYTITQADIDAGKVVNTALATAQDPKGNDVTDISGTSVDNNTPTDTPLTQNPSIALVKTATVSGTGKVGDVITYTFAVTNTGNTSLTNVVVTDPMVGLTITGNPIATLAVGASNATIKGTYTITQADIDAGKVVNTALATAQDPKENDVTDISGTSVDNNTSTDTPLTQNPSIALVKTATVSGTGKVGDVITYTFAVTNTGNTSLTNVVVTDPMVGLTITGNPIATLAVGASNATIKGTYTITQADIDAGKVVNTALATAQDPKENDVTDISGTSVDNNTSTDTPLTQNPSIALVKTATVSGTGKVGDVITYIFAVTNTGNTSLTNVVVTDPMVGLTITGNPIATLAVGASNATIKGTYTITQADIDAGKVVNTALATAQDPKENDVTDISGTSVDNNTSTDTPLTQNPSIALVKTATVSGTGKVGDVITYIFAVTNTGNTSLTNVVVTDPMVGLTITGNPIATLAVGASNATIKGTYTITQADIDAGKVVNTALATAQDPKGNDVTDISGTSVDNNTSTDTPLTQNPSIALVKTATVSGTGKVGDVITYTFAVTNTGNTSLTNVVVTDPMVGLTITGNPIATLAVGASNATIKGTYTITQADIDAGKVVNTALATAQDPKGNDVTDISGTSVDNNTSTDTPLTQNPSIALVKTATVSGTGKVGDVITYIFAVTNTGNTSLTNVVVTDPMVGLTITGNPIATLAVGASNATIKGTYTITQADIDAGKVVNTALATAQDPKGNDVTDISGTSVDNNTPTDTPLTQNPSIALVKTATVSGTGKVGDVITYTFAVTNTGNTSLTNVVVTDPMVGLTITGNPIATLAVGASNATIKGTYTITQADIDAGKVVNTALATAQDPKGNDVTDISGTSVDNNTPTDTPLTQNPSIALVKTATVSGTGKVGDVITYTFAVTNTGNTSLTNVVVTDPMVGLTITGNPIATLAVGASNATIKGTYTITQADIDAGKVVNTALATAQDPKGNDVTDISGTSVDNNTSTDTPLTQNPSIALVKTATVSGTGKVGDVITYTFAVTNTGNTSLTNVVVTDPMVGLTITGNPIATLAVGASNATIKGTYTITQADIDAGKVVNTALATAQDPKENDVTDISGTSVDNNTPTDTPLTQNPSIALVKTATVSGTGKVGDVITYTFAVTNTGNTSLTNVVVTDPMVGLTITGNPIATLAVGASNATIKGTYTITQADIDAGKVVNTALATAQDPKENDVTDISGTSVDNNTPTDTPLTQNPSIALVKTATVSGTGKVGDVITYTFAVTNTGNTSLTNVVVTDPMVGLTITGNPIATLAVGASNATIKGTYTITQADIDAGKVVNTALATAQDPKGNDVTDISGTSVDNNTPTDTPLTQNPSIALVKTATVSGTGKVGDVITYTFAVTNTGNTSLTNVVVTDPMVGLTITGNPIATLAVGASNATIKGTYTITQADIDAGKVVNTALATAQDPKGNDVTDISGTSVDNNTPTDTPLTQNPSIALVKTATVSGTGKVGDVITYTFAVTNTGNTSLTNVVVTDPMVGLTITGNPIATLAVGASNATIKGTYTITQADIDAGKVVNTALATAQDPKENDVTDISGTSVDNNTSTDTPLTQNPSIALVKTATVSGTGKVGDVITYTFAVTNTGNTSLTNVVVTDPMVGLTITGNPIATLAVGASNATIKGTYTITQADIDAGKVVNTALATAQDPKENDVTDISGTSVDNNTSTDTPLTQNPSIALVKTATVSGTGKVGDVITYIFAVTNTGNTSLTNVVVTDPMVGLTITGNPIATLAVGASNATIKGTYTITQADIDVGKVVNTALATAQDPKENDVTDISGTSVDNNTSTDTPLTQNPSIALVKTATVSGTGKVGDVITYTFAVTNTGNTSLTNVVVTDPMVGLTITGNPIATLAVGASNATIKGTYTITQADIDAGKVVNTALATAQDPKENDVTDISGTSVDNNTSTDTPLTQNPSIALVKTATVSGTGKVGDVITYTFAVTNTGNTSLTNVVVTDPMVGLTITGNPIATLAVGASNATIKGTYTITQADIDAGKVVNTALATAQDPKENDVTDISGTSVDNNTSTDTPLTQNPSIALVKTATVSGTGKVGDVITYTFAVTNTGNTSLTNVVVTDPMVGLTITGNPIATLAVGASNATIKGTYTITQADIDAGKVVNTALATAQDPKENDVTDISGTSVDNNTSTDTPLTQNPSIALVKTATVSGTGKVGDVITYTFAVTNTGNTSLTNVVVTDPMVGLTITGNPIATLAVGASNATIKGTYTITQADIDAGKVVNTALATAQDPKENDVTDISGTSVDNNTPTDTPLTQNPSIALVKTATVSGTGKVGDVITYTFAVTNTGNTSLTNVVVTDPMVGLTITGNPIATLAVGASNATIKGTYTITQADIDAGKVVNTALATAQDPKENDVTDISGTSVDNNTPTDTPLTQNPSIALVKTATVSGTGKVGDVITYTFAVTNTGNTSLTNVVVTDPMVGLTITGNPIATLAVGASNATIKGTYTITQADIDAGKVVNTALATAQDPKENDVTDISGTSVDNNTPTDTPLTQNPSIALVKTATVSGTGKVGDVITYTFAVTNTGNTSLTNVVVTDPMVGLTITGNPIATLAVGASNATIKGTYTITQADIDAGKVVNTALATAQDPKENDVTDISGTSVDNNTPTDTPLTQNPSIALVKTATVSGTGKVGDVITYTFAVTNTGNTSLTNVVVTDPMVGLTITGNPIATLAVGASNATIKGTYTITQADIDAGKVVNTALATAQDPKENDVTDISGTSVDNNTPTDTPLTQNPSIALVKTATVSGTGKVGDVITYTFAVTNTGNTSLTNVVVTDPMVGLTITGNPIATLAVGASNATIKGTYTITQADIDAGKVVNTALATAQDPKENDVTDISGTSVDNNTPTDTPLTQNPSIALVKTATVSGTGKVGDVITYTFAVTNTGNTSLTNVVVTDPMVGLTITGNPIATLAVGASNATIKGTYTITQADIDAGKVVNTALATAQDPKENDVTDISGTSVDNNTPTDTPLTQNPSIALVKTATVSGTGKVGDVITYTFAVTNTGNTSLTNVVVTDPMVGLTITGNPIATLAVGASNATIKGTYTITQADIDAGKVVNTALATAQDPKENDVTDISGTSVDNNTPTDTPLTQNPSIALVKTATVSGTGKVGDVITYTFAVTNTGNTSLTNVVVTDPMVGLTITGNPIATLAVGASNATIKGTYTITQADIDAGKVVNTALATAQDPKENDVTDISGTSVDNNTSTDTPLTQNPSIALVKTATVSGTGKVGDVITYTFAVTNTGNTSLTNVVVTDPMVGLTITGNPIATLAVGASNATIKGTYTITQADIDAGKVVNTALATAQDPKENDVTDISGTSVDNNTPTDTPLTQNPSIALVKTATVSGTGKVGDVITYTFAVTNTGNTSLTNVVVTDPMVGLTITGNPIATLAVGASNATIKGTYTITQADIDAGKVVNTALATAQDPKGNDVTDISGTSVDNNTSTDTPLTQKGSIVLVKKGVFADTNNDGFAQAGEKINYSFTITNTGNVTVTNIAIADPMPGLTITNSPIASLLAGANATVTGTYILTQADVDGGKVTNSALATGKDPNGKDVKDISGTTVENDTATTTPLVQSAKLEVIKTASTDGYSLAGDVISYTIEVKNTGTVTLYQILVTDPLTGLSTTIASLAPGRSQLFNENYTITKIDLVNNIVTNTATANGFTPNNTSISASDSVDVEKSLVLGCGTILVHNAFSPNGDGINDVFTIDNIGDTSCYPENTVEIYNRWGVLVFETKNYNNQSNNFEGISRGRTTISQSTGLPTGTYFYILNYTSVDGNGDIQTNKKDGYLYLAK